MGCSMIYPVNMIKSTSCVKLKEFHMSKVLLTQVRLITQNYSEDDFDIDYDSLSHLLERFFKVAKHLLVVHLFQ